MMYCRGDGFLLLIILSSNIFDHYSTYVKVFTQRLLIETVIVGVEIV